MCMCVWGEINAALHPACPCSSEVSLLTRPPGRHRAWLAAEEGPSLACFVVGYI